MFSKHVAKSDEFLKNRVEESIKQFKNSIKEIPDATSFHDLATAEKALRDAFQTTEGQKLLKNVIQFSKSNVPIYFNPVVIKNVGRDLGYGYKEINGLTKKIIEKLTALELRIKTDGKGGFEVISVFPKI